MPVYSNTSHENNDLCARINFIYNIGYRLTGSHRRATKLVEDALIKNPPGTDDRLGALKSLCAAFKSQYVPDSLHYCLNTDDHIDTQRALLTLPPIKRLVLILRDVVGLGYPEIARVAALKEFEATNLLSSARRLLQKEITGISKKNPEVTSPEMGNENYEDNFSVT